MNKETVSHGGWTLQRGNQVVLVDTLLFVLRAFVSVKKLSGSGYLLPSLDGQNALINLT